MKISRYASLLGVLTLMTFVLGCGRRDEQQTLESQTVNFLMRVHERYEHEHPGIPVTNLSQIFQGLRQEYPHQLHQRFSRFGNHKGFANSVYEKYVFFPPGLTNKFLPGELIFMNAKPYPDAYGDFQRNLVSKFEGTYHRGTILEDRIQQWFREAGIIEPKPVAMPRPPPAPPTVEYRQPLSVSIDGFFVRLAREHGISKWWILRDTTIALLLVLFVATILLIWRTRSRRR